MTPAPAHQAFDAARQQAGLTNRALWMRYFALGGMATQAQLTDHLVRGEPLGSGQHDVMVQALNERFTELDLNHPVPYSSE